MTELLMKLMDEVLLLTNEQRRWFLEVDSTPDKDAVKSVEMTSKNLEYYLNLVIKQRQGLRGLTQF